MLQRLAALWHVGTWEVHTSVRPGVEGDVHHGILAHVVTSARSERQEADAPARHAPCCEALEPVALRLRAEEGLVLEQQP